MELNCIHNITMQIRTLVEKDKIKREDAREIEGKLTLADKYLTAWNHNKEVKWHEVIKNPDVFPTQAEYNEKMFKKLKALPNVGDIIKVRQIYDEQGYTDMILEENPKMNRIWEKHDDKNDWLFQASTYFDLEAKVLKVENQDGGDWFIHYEVHHPNYGKVRLLTITHIEYDDKECWSTVGFEIVKRCS